MTDTQRTATEQLLVSQAIDMSVSEIDVSPLAGKDVFFDSQYLEGVVDRGYLISSLRQHLLANGCRLQEDRSKAAYVVEVRSGGVGTNRHGLLIGVPQMNVPALLPGQPSQIPEIPLAKKTDQEGIAKVAVFAYNRLTGQPVWQSGVVQANSTAKDFWFLGAGPFQRGNIRKGTQLAGEPLPLPQLHLGPASPAEEIPGVIPVTCSACWRERPGSRTELQQAGSFSQTTSDDGRVVLSESNRLILSILNNSPMVGSGEATQPWPGYQQGIGERNPASIGPAPAGKAPAAPGTGANLGGQAETEPSNIFSSGLGSGKPGIQMETWPSRTPEAAGGVKAKGKN
jgi:hypothetical protein